MLKLAERCREIPIKKLDKVIELAHDHNKYCIIFDKNENANVFFEYKATLRDIHKESIAV